uniref:Peptidase M1 leukotriene A4 hydrolase/aminopeptidase C-terminal domain-containing protein n=1 Tax=Strigamia maritima TaxID=126957 RepID=T1JA77_STRMM
MEQADDESDQEYNYDLPLLSNVDEILIRHYAISLSCDFNKKRLSGHVILFLDLLSREQSDDRLQFVLDCKDITIESVESLIFDNDDQLNNILHNTFIYEDSNIDLWLKLERKRIFFKLSDWKVNIWSDETDFPRVVRIAYHTNETGSSLTWTRDQDGRCCVFTQGALINNRSLVPCQEPPVAMATWQAKIETDDGVVVLMSGDDDGKVRRLDDGRICHYYCTRIVLPMSTLALAIGYWSFVDLVTQDEALSSPQVELYPDGINADKCLHESFPCHVKSDLNRTLLPCRLFAPKKHLETAKKELINKIPCYMKSCTSLLGRHPFPRLDILLTPRCFASLGLANPHLLFISQSLISGDGTMAIHIAHELCHSWFGLSIGALDWTEEWLSEGFATYMEDQVHSMAQNWCDRERLERCEIRSFLRFRLLELEMENTDQELQVLRRDNDEKKLSNGMNPLKCFSQVHYLKGFFLLRRLSLDVGERAFNLLLRDYVTKHHGCLISSKQIFQIYFDRFPRVETLSMNNIYRDWLDFPGMPKDLSTFNISSDNSIYQRVVYEVLTSVVGKWKAINRSNLKRVKKTRLQIELHQVAICHETYYIRHLIGGRNFWHNQAPYRELSLRIWLVLDGDELVLFLELILEIKRLSATTLSSLNDHFGLDKKNAHIKHRWLELVVKHDYNIAYGSLIKFLEEDQSMGIYLYGELINSNRKHQQNLAKSTFNQLRTELDQTQRKTIEKMLKC